MFRKAKSFPKYIYIFIYGSLLFGGCIAVLFSLLIELSYPTPTLRIFFINFCHRLLVSLPVFMLTGIIVGHWRWTFAAKNSVR